MVSTGCITCIPHQQVGALIKNEQVRTVEVAANTTLSRPRVIAFAIIKSSAVTVNSATAFNGNVLRIHGIEKNNIAIARRHTFARYVIFTFG